MKAIILLILSLFLVGIGNSVWAGDIRANVDQQDGINSTDAMLTLRNSLSLTMDGTNWQATTTTGDVDCDGDSDNIDARLILRHSLGMSMDDTEWCERTYYIAEDGYDTNPGTKTLPFRHIPGTAQWSGNYTPEPNDTLLLRRGGVWQTSINNWQWSGAVNLLICIGAYGEGDDPVIDATNQNHALILNNIRYVSFKNIEFRNSLNTVALMYNSHHLNFIQCNIHDCHSTDTYDSAMFFVGNSDNNFISYCHIGNTSSILGDCLGFVGEWENGQTIGPDNNIIEHSEFYGPAANGIYMRTGGKDNIVRYNYIHNINGIAIQLRDRMENTLVHNNLIHDCTGPVIQSDGENSVCEGQCPSEPAAMAGTKIINNTIYSTSTDSGTVNLFGENNRDNLGKCEFRNNIVICADSYCIQAEQSHDDDFVIDHNVYYASKPDTWVFYNGNDGWSTITEWQNNSPHDDHSLLISPQLTQQPPTTVSHFKLQSSSPCIGKGVATTLFNDDYFGISRPQGSGWDVGAHELSN